MPRPTVTIPIAAYNTRPDHLAAAVESALAQTWREVEVVVSDDSPDPSLRAVADRFRDPRVRYRHNAPGLGVARNHWACFREAGGEYVAVLNHDDLFAPDFLERLVPPLADDPRLAVGFCDHWVIDGDGRRLVAETDRNSAFWGRAGLAAGPVVPFFRLFAAQTIPMVMGAVFRRGVLPAALPDRAGPAYDLWLTYLLCRGGHGAYYLPDRLSSWRAHPGNLTSRGGLDWMRGAAECWDAAARDPNLFPVRSAVRSNAAAAYSSYAVGLWRAGRPGRCLRAGWRSVRARPTRKGLIACLLPVVPRAGASA